MSDRIADAISYIKDLFADNAGGHDVAHTLRVYRNAMSLAERISECDREIVALAALLHDADDHKLFHTVNNANARRFLEQSGVGKARIEWICEAINSVSFSQNKGEVPKTIEGKIVQDADRLDAIGAIGVARCFAFGGEHGRSMEESVQHFYDKLLTLKGTMNTDEAKRVAEKRHQFLETFLAELEEETGIVTGGEPDVQGNQTKEE